MHRSGSFHTNSSGRALRTLLTATAFLLLTVLAFGQGYFGTMSGLLTDATGAVVQGARVTLQDEQKGYKFTAMSDSNGRYLFASIPPGLYTVSAEMPGFQKTVRTGIKLNVSENPTANLTFKIAGATQEVKVEAQAQGIATEDAVTGQVVDRRLINDLPLIGRDVTELTYLTPGVTDMDDQCHNCGATNFVSNGSRGASADILMDGASVTNFEPNGGVTEATYTPSPEAVEEFKVQQTNFSAEYGFSGASILNMVTRSGTNSFHGSVYDFIRNTITDANDFFNNRSGIPIPPVHRHDFGATIGGPIWKNKTFFFFDYEGLRASDMRTYQAGVPSTAMRNGDFGELCPIASNTDANGGVHPATWDTTQGDPNYGACVQADDMTRVVASGQLWDPYSGAYNSSYGGAARSAIIPFNNIANYTSPGNPNLNGTAYQLPGTPGNLIDPVAQKVMNLFPHPTATMANPTIYRNWIASGATPNSNNQFDLKIDHRFSEKHLLSGKYSQEWSTSASFNCFKDLIDPCGHGADKSTAHLFAINDSYSFSPTLLLTTTLGLTRGAFRLSAYDSSLNSDPLGALGFPSYLNANGFKGVPAMFINGYSHAGFPNAGNNPYGNYKQGKDTGQLTVMLSKIHGSHELKFGAEGRLHQMNYIQTNAPLGYFQFDNRGSSLCPFPGISTPCSSDPNQPNPTAGGDAMASFLMGQMLGNGNSYYEIQFQPATENYQYATFAQDNWKVNQKLTLNLGLRYDVSLPRTDRYNRQNWFDPNVVSPLNGGTFSYTDPITNQPVTRQLLGGEVFASGSRRTNYVADWKDFQPRFGLAFQFSPKMVLRGGYGIYYGQSRSGATGVAPYGSEGFDQYTNVISTYQSDGATPYLHLSNPFPNGLIQPPGSSLRLMNDVGHGANGPLRTRTADLTPYEQSWSLGIERQMAWNVVFDVEYLGKKGTHLPFSGSNQLNILGPQVESYGPNSPQMNALNTLYTNPPGCSPTCNPFYGIITDPNSGMSSAVSGYQLQLPHPQFTGVTTDVRMIATSIYHGLQLQANKRFSNGLEFLVNYTWSKSLDDASIGDDNVTWLGSFTSLQDPNKPWLERSLSTFDTPSVLKFSYSYDLPFGRGRELLGNMPRWAEAIVGGWKTNGIWQIADGRPLAVTVSGGGTPIPTYGNQRPNIVGKPRRNYGHDWVDQFFVDASVFQAPAAFTLGNAPRTIASVRTPLSFTSDLSVSKQFMLSSVHEGIRMELRLEAQNAFNHPLFSLGTPGPNGDSTLNVGDPSFGIIPRMANSPRQVQLAVKFNF
jgi:hypothetical protein